MKAFFYCSSAGKTIASVAVALVLATQAFAVEVRGRVINLLGQPVANAAVSHRASGNRVSADQNGHFLLNVPEQEKVRIEITHPDYFDQELLITGQRLSREIIITLVPYIIQREEVVVTAMRHPESSASIPAAETVISSAILQEKLVPHITEGLSDVVGVSSIGSGGFSLVPNIRGLARRRVLLMIDMARVTSDRRTGPNASFIDPMDIERIEILRSPSSVFYGSDAIGGVIHIMTKNPGREQGLRGDVNLKYGTVNEEKNLGLALRGSRENWGFYLSFKGTDAQNYSSPHQEILQSQFTQGSLLGKAVYATDEREFQLSFLGARGYDIGKANSDSATKPTWYPEESQNLFQFQWVEKELGKGGQLSLHGYLNSDSLETIKEKYEGTEGYKQEKSYSETKGLNFGIQLCYSRKINDHFRLTGGMDFYGRSNVRAYNSYTDFDPAGQIIDFWEEFPFVQGSRKDFGLFFSVDFSGIENFDLVGGIRWDDLRMKALPGDIPPEARSTHKTWTGFCGGSWSIADEIIFFANLSRAYRAPSLSELFYTGITGRGSIIAQPGLNPETSFNLDGGLKFIFKRLFAGIYTFYYKIDGLIERYEIDPVENIYTYGNVDRGVIRGYELELEYYPVPKWKIFGHYFSFNGESQATRDALNDVPPPRLYLGTRFWLNRFSVQVNTTFQQEKADPGPAEVEIPAFAVVNLKASYQFGHRLSLYFVLSNLFNVAYLARPDREAVEEPGRNFLFGLNYHF